MRSIVSWRMCTLFVLSCMAAGANAVTLDVSADAVVGKPGFTSSTTGSASASFMLRPVSIAEDPYTGELWVSDDSGNRVLRFASSHAFLNGDAANLVLGQAAFTDSGANRGGTAAANTMFSPESVAVDGVGRLYVSDYANNRILIFHPPYTNGMNAYAVLGQADMTSASMNRGGAVSSSSLSGPMGLALDAQGNLYVADYHNNRVLRYDEPFANGEAASRVFGQGTSNNFTASAATVSATGMAAPTGVTVDASGNLWVADRGNNRALRFDGVTATTDVQADLVLCQSTFLTAGAGSTATTCNTPSAMAVDLEGNVYLVDTVNDRVLRFTTVASGGAADIAIGQLTLSGNVCNQGGTRDENKLCMPATAIVNRSGDLLVADGGNGRVLRYDVPHPRVAPTLASMSPDAVPQGRPVTLTINGAGFYNETVVRVNGSAVTTTYVSGRRLVASVPAASTLGTPPYYVRLETAAPGGGSTVNVALAGYSSAPFDMAADRVLGQVDFATTGSAPRMGGRGIDDMTASNLQSPLGIASVGDVWATGGRLFVSDYAYHRVLSWPNAVAFNNAEPADVILGQLDEGSTQCNQGAGSANATTLCNPDGVAVDDDGALYVADRSNNRVLMYAPPFSTGMAATRVWGQNGSFTTAIPNNGGVSASSLSSPSGIAWRRGWRTLFVNDSSNRRILVYNNPATSLAADYAIGQPDLASALNAPPSAQRFAGMGNIAVDIYGSLYAAFYAQSRVLKFSAPFATNMLADTVLGQPDFITATPGAVSAASLSGPWGITTDAQGHVYVADAATHRVLQFWYSGASGRSATMVLGQPNFTSSAAGTSASSFAMPSAIGIHNQTDLLVAEIGNNRVMRFLSPGASPSTLTVVRAGAGSGSVISEYPLGIDCGTACSATYATMTEVRLVATPAAGSVFGGWSPACGLSPSCTFRYGGNITVTATFLPAPEALTVTKTGTGQGSVTSSPAGIDCGATCAATYDYGTGVTLTALAANGSVFTGWSGAGCTGTGTCTITMNSATAVTANFDSPTRSVGISTRMGVLTGDNVMIAGFIISGAAPKTVVVRARGPSLGVTGALANPALTLVPGDGSPAMSNDDWGTAANAAQLQATGYHPAHPQESAIMATLNPGAYTAIVSGVGNSTGVAIAEVYEIDHPEIPMTGISTRGFVRTGDNVMIGGFIIQGSAPQTVVVRARGPSLGVAGALADPTLTLVPADGSPAIVNDDWGTAANAAQLQSIGYQPAHPKESAILITLNPGAYTAIVSGVGGTAGIGIVEVYTP